MLKNGGGSDSLDARKGISKWVYVLFGVMFLAFVVFLLRPSLIGYSVYQEVAKTNYSLEEYGQSVQSLRGELAIAHANSSIYADQYGRASDELQDIRTSFYDCSSDRVTLGLKLNQSISDCASSVVRLQQQIDSLNSEAESLHSDIKSAQLEKKDVSAQCAAEREAVASDLKVACDEKVKYTGSELTVLQESYDHLVSNTARSVCCKARFDDPSLDSFDVLADKVVCIRGGTKELEC